MGLLENIFGGKSVVVTSTAIRTEIDRNEADIAILQAKVQQGMAGLATMTDAEHVSAEADIAATKRAISRLDARVAHLSSELAKIIAAEEFAAKDAANEALRQRAEAARKANDGDAAKLLTEYNALGAKMGAVLARLAETAAKRNEVNAELNDNPVAESVPLYDSIHRQHPSTGIGQVGYFELPLSQIVLPPGFAGGAAHWPRN